MSEELLRSYRLSSTEEPSDEMLLAIMEKVAEAARAASQRAEASKKRMFEETLRRINANRNS